jgi:hypothetical protein
MNILVQMTSCASEENEILWFIGINADVTYVHL